MEAESLNEEMITMCGEPIYKVTLRKSSASALVGSARGRRTHMLLIITLPTTHVPNPLRRPELVNLILHLLPNPSILGIGNAWHGLLVMVDLALKS